MSQTPKWKKEVENLLPKYLGSVTVMDCANKREALEYLKRTERECSRIKDAIRILEYGLPYSPPRVAEQPPPPAERPRVLPPDGERVRLTVDLREYDKRCAVGAEGRTGPPCDMWARTYPSRFVGVYFDSGARLDVLWTGLERVKHETQTSHA